MVHNYLKYIYLFRKIKIVIGMIHSSRSIAQLMCIYLCFKLPKNGYIDFNFNVSISLPSVKDMVFWKGNWYCSKVILKYGQYGFMGTSVTYFKHLILRSKNIRFPLDIR